MYVVLVVCYSALELNLAREEIELGGAYILMRDSTWIKPIAAI
jgi:hypothetical protein